VAIDDTPVTIAGTLPVWTPREPDLSFPRHSNGRLHLPNESFRRNGFPLVIAGPRKWRVRHQEDDLEDVIPLVLKSR
jgi:hypothetical protein